MRASCGLILMAALGGCLAAQRVHYVDSTKSPTGAYFEQTVSVVVTDGRLTIVAPAGANVCFIQITGQ